MPQQTYTFKYLVRPPAVRAFCALGQRLRQWGWERPLAIRDIVRRAQRRSGLKDWGDDFFLEPLERLTEAFEAEAKLTPFGRWFIRELLIGMVRRRLQIHDYLRRNPEVIKVRLRDPLIVVGMPRTGTTLLFNLLCQDPGARPLMRWESLQPAPPLRPGFWGGDARVRYSRFSADILRWLAPALDKIHPIDPLGPEECTWLMANTLHSPAFGMFGHIPSYDEWLWALGDQGWERVYEDYVTQLLILQHQHDAGHWVLKSPVHLISLGPLLNKIPRARVLLTYRDPQEVVPSACSLYAVLRGIGSDHIDFQALGEEMLANLAKALHRAETVQALYPAQVLCIQYRELTRDKIGTMKTIYSYFDLPFSKEAELRIARWVNESTHEKSHSYGLSQFGLTPDLVQERFY